MKKTVTISLFFLVVISFYGQSSEFEPILGTHIGNTNYKINAVIPLYEIGVNSNISESKHIIGQFIAYRAAYYDSAEILDVNFRFSNYASGNRNDVNWVRSGQGTRGNTLIPVIFNYNGKRYFGLKVNATDINRQIIFKGIANSSIGLTVLNEMSFVLIEYYNDNTDAIINSEINNSLNFDLESVASDRTYISKKFQFNDNNILHANNYEEHLDSKYVKIDNNGNVGIGTNLSSNPNNYKLAVNGNIGAKEVKVENTSSTWPDYVFSKKYDLPTLQEVEQHIKEKGHLKNIPSAKEVAKNGIFLGEMNAKLLQK